MLTGVDDMDDFIVPDDSDDDVRPSTKRKRPSNNTSRKPSSSRGIVDEDEVNEIDFNRSSSNPLQLGSGRTTQRIPNL